MKIFKIENDFRFKDLTFLNEEDVSLFSTFIGKKITLDWKEEIFGISEDIHTRGKLLDFDSRCYGDTLIIKGKFKNLFIEKFSDIIEIFPIKIKGIADDYIYINVTNVVTAINFDGLDLQESLAMMRSKNILFKLENLGKESIFRDTKINSSYYCTQKFIDFIEGNEINGLCFEEIGTAK
ncbi:hypothetical protein [Lysinibacillus sphaericus]|uniref:hypothetical protein n=1 Tax=Lysinibacillus sphaericus TaxID=1421 RepID=UPI003D7060D4